MSAMVFALKAILFSSLCYFISGEDLFDLPEGVTEEDPVRLFVQAGQSNCGGSASAKLLVADNDTYPDLVGTIDNVWLATTYNPEKTFKILPMVAGEAKNGKFGPEVSIGQRLAEASSSTSTSPIMIVKYCKGGSNIATQWNPATSDNDWDRDEDEGTAAWLLDNGYADLGSKKTLYANLMYIVRSAVETLEEASIPYEFSGLFFIQGSADKKISTWDEYAEDAVRLFSTFRTDIDQPDLPIVDHGGAPHHNIYTGKVYAAEVLGNASVAAWGWASQNPDDCCVPGPTDPCTGATFLNYDMIEYYGYDPNYPDEIKPEGFTSNEFSWFVEFPTNVHFEYEGMILRGRVMANTFVREFAPDWLDKLTPAMEVDDAQVLFPWEECPPGEKPTVDNACWMNQSKDTTPVVELDCAGGDGGGGFLSVLIKLIYSLLKQFVPFLF